MSYALKVARAHKGKVCMICKTSLDEANTSFAQGGVASVTNLEVDNFDKHIQDTMIAGDYISDYKAVQQVVTKAPEQIKELVQWGVNFDKQQDGKFDLHREGGHSEFRILHHADDTGAEIQRGLMEAVRSNPDIDIKENHFAVEIITQHHLGARVTRRTPYINCYGAYVLNPETQKVDTYLSKVTVMCTGGCGAVYQTTTNPVIATGDGEAMVYRAKGTVADMEFVQFHPTALFHPGETHPAFLITEAMRGYGGILRLPNGESFMEKYDERLSLAPRDIVARAIDKEMKIHGIDHVCLDVTHKDPEETKHHFPNIYKKCLSIGIDITKEYIPVRPAAHYMCGGIKVDLNGESSIKRLYAIGECSCTAAISTHRLCDEVCRVCLPRMIKGSRVELYELHVLYRSFGSVYHCFAVAGCYYRVCGGLVYRSAATGTHQCHLAQIGVHLLCVRVQHVGTITLDVWCATCHYDTQMVLCDYLNGKVVFLDVYIRVAAYRLHQSTLYFRTGIVGMVKNSEL